MRARRYDVRPPWKDNAVPTRPSMMSDPTVVTLALDSRNKRKDSDVALLGCYRRPSALTRTQEVMITMQALSRSHAKDEDLRI